MGGEFARQSFWIGVATGDIIVELAVYAVAGAGVGATAKILGDAAQATGSVVTAGVHVLNGADNVGDAWRIKDGLDDSFDTIKSFNRVEDGLDTAKTLDNVGDSLDVMKTLDNVEDRLNAVKSADTMGYQSDMGVSQLTEEELRKVNSGLENHPFYERWLDESKEEEYCYKQRIEDVLRKINRANIAQIIDENGMAEYLPYLYGDIPYLDAEGEAKWNEKRLQAFEKEEEWKR